MDKKSVKSKIQNPKTRRVKKEPLTMGELLAQKSYKIPAVKLGDYVEGTLASIQRKEVLVNIGGKASAVVGSKELESIFDLFDDYKAGDKVTGRVISEENREGRAVLSLIKFAYDNRWEKLKKVYKKGEEIKILVRDTVNGGLLVDYNNIRGYIPPNHIDPDFSSDPGKLRGQLISAKILEIEQSQNRFVVSQKFATRKDEIKKQKEAMAGVKAGEKVEAIVEDVVGFGLFVRIPVSAPGSVKTKADKEIVFIDGLVHISEISWEKVDNPAQFYKKGDKVKAVILDKDEKEGKLNLSIKLTTKDPWTSVAKKYKEGDLVKGKITRRTAYGLFIELERGIEGLAHISGIPVGKELKKGEKVAVQIDKLDKKERRIALSIIPTKKPVVYR